ncbi:MAG: hypothetical protein H0X24_00955 [Ktedonobacterales bacterium]|nr:hypothetical protein [Ktedonobacterales bacterium]
MQGERTDANQSLLANAAAIEQRHVPDVADSAILWRILVQQGEEEGDV